MEKLFERTLQRQLAEQKQAAEMHGAKVDALQAQLAAQSAQMAELAALLKGQLVLGPAAAPRPPGMAIEHAAQVNTGPVTNTHIERPVTNQTVNQIINIMPWDGERRISVGVAQIAAAFAENARLKEYASWPDHELTDPELAPPYVTELFMDLTKRAHLDPSARNVYLNPKRADQVLVHMKSGRWEVLPLADATRLLFDGVAETIHRTMMTYAELRQLPLEAQNAMTMAEMVYQDEPEEYVKRAKAPMGAHLANCRDTAPALGAQ